MSLSQERIYPDKKIKDELATQLDIGHMIGSGINIIHNTNPNSDVRRTEILTKIIEPYMEKFTIEEVSGVLEIVSREKGLTNEDINVLAGLFALTTTEGVSYMKSNNKEAFRMTENIFKKIVEESIPLDDVTKLKTLKARFQGLLGYFERGLSKWAGNKKIN